MKWSWNFIISLVFLTCCFSYAISVTTEDLKTMFLRFYTGNEIKDYIDVYLEEAETLIQDLNISKPMVFYIHGYTESVNSTSVQLIVNAYLNRSDHNIISLDWSVIAAKNYIKLAIDLEPVGELAAFALNDIVQAGFPSESIHVVAHSMGGQLAGYVGRNVNFPLPRITDPAGPLFNFNGERLTSSDAQFVDVIHTDLGIYGIAFKSGTVDFFPNGGRRIQPGCPTAFFPGGEADFCSHHRSWKFYAESVTKEEAFIAVKCSTHLNKRRSYDYVIMGYGTQTDAEGSYCLVTDSSSPYGLRLKGARATA